MTHADWIPVVLGAEGAPSEQWEPPGLGLPGGWLWLPTALGTCSLKGLVELLQR